MIASASRFDQSLGSNRFRRLLYMTGLSVANWLTNPRWHPWNPIVHYRRNHESVGRESLVKRRRLYLT